MADQPITSLPVKTSSGMAATDYLLGIDSAEGYQMLIQDLGDYIIQHATSSLAGQSQTLANVISGLNSNKANKSATVSTVAYDTTNKKLTKTINGTTSDIVSASALKTDMALNNVGNFKAVSTVASQGLSSTEKSNARANIGAGTSSLALGTTSSTAYRGDYGNSAYAHAVTNKGSAFSSGLYKITTNSEGHVTAATAVAKADITGLGIPGDAGVTGVKGSTETSYRTGNVNLTATDVGAVAKSGDTMTGNLIVPAERIANTYYGVSFGRTNETPVETILYTGIKWASGVHMPVVHITGYAYGLSSPVEFKIGFYIYNNKIGWCGVTNMGSWAPNVYLFKYQRNSVGYVAVGLAGSCHFLQLQADVQDEMGKFNNIVFEAGAWSWSFLTTTGNIPTPDNGVTCVQVSYMANILNPSKVNGYTVNANVPSGAKFTDTVTTASTSGSGNAVTAISASNGALTVTKGTTFLTSHQDISGKADKSATVSTVAWDSTNRKLTKTINGTTTDIVTYSTLYNAFDCRMVLAKLTSVAIANTALTKLNIQSYKPSGYNLYAVQVLVGTASGGYFPLPWMDDNTSAGLMVRSFNDNQVVLRNNGTGWGTCTVWLTLTYFKA